MDTIIKQQISNKPNINFDRFIEVSVHIGYHVTLSGRTFYQDENGEEVNFIQGVDFNYSTDGNFVNMNTGEPAQMVEVTTTDPVTEEVTTTMEYPQGTIPESVFLQQLPIQALPVTTFYDGIKMLVGARIQALDLAGKFN